MNNMTTGIVGKTKMIIYLWYWYDRYQRWQVSADMW